MDDRRFLRSSIGRIVLAVIIGYAANAVLVGTSEWLLSLWIRNIPYFLADLLTQCLYTIAAGYLCCLIARSSKRIATIGLIVLGLLVGTTFLIESWWTEPHWYGLALLAEYAPCVWIGHTLESRMRLRNFSTAVSGS